MKTRIITGVVGIGILSFVLYLFNTPVFDMAVALVCILAIHELFTAFDFKRNQSYLYWPLVPFTLVVMLAHGGWARTVIMPFAVCLMVFYAAVLITRHDTLPFARFGGFATFTGIVLLSFYSLVAMKLTLPSGYYRGDAVYFVLLILCIAWGGDTFAYFTGFFFGKHKLAPVVSPKKTIEGAIGGVIGSILCAIVLTLVYSRLMGSLPLGQKASAGWPFYVGLVLLAAVGSVLGIIGDLFASVVKRQQGIKDYGTIFPGHGGVMDRFDSVMFVAPFVTTMVISVYFFLVH